MRVHKKFLWWGISIVVILVVLGFLSTMTRSTYELSGTIVQRPYGFGLQSNWSITRPFGPNHFGLTGLPVQWQKPGTKVRGTFALRDVIGTGTWDVIVTPITITSD